MIATRLNVSAATAAAALSLIVGAFGVAAPASAETVADPTASVTSVAGSGATASPTAAPSAAVASPATKPPKKKAKKGKAKISHYKRLTKKAKKVAVTVRDRWHLIRTIGGWRAGSRYSGDHPAGRAVDVMIPSWRKNTATGTSIAKYFTKNAKRYKIHYVIYRQKIWTVQNPRWRGMAGRGGVTANHFDHVHISVKR